VADHLVDGLLQQGHARLQLAGGVLDVLGDGLLKARVEAVVAQLGGYQVRQLVADVVLDLHLALACGLRQNHHHLVLAEVGVGDDAWRGARLRVGVEVALLGGEEAQRDRRLGLVREERGQLIVDAVGEAGVLRGRRLAARRVKDGEVLGALLTPGAGLRGGRRLRGGERGGRVAGADHKGEQQRREGAQEVFHGQDPVCVAVR
jgi:hypothetical protein